MVWQRYRNEDLSHVIPATWGEVGKAFLIALPAVALPFVIRAAVVGGVATATEVSTIGIVYSALAGLLIYRKFEWKRLYPMLTETAALSGAILLIIGAATGMAWALTQSGFSSSLAKFMTGLPGGVPVFLAVTIVAFIVLGSVLEGIPAIVLFGPLLFPIAKAVGVHEVHYAMVVILAMGIGLFAPPFGVGYYAACAISRIHPDEGIKPMLGYVLALLIGTIVIAAVPWFSIGLLALTPCDLEFEDWTMKDLLNFGEMLSVHARLAPDRLGTRDLDRSMTFGQWNERACRLANALLGLGLAKGDRVAILAYNCVEWCEIFAATAKAGLVALPINFRLVGKEVEFIVNNAEAAAVIVQDELRRRGRGDPQDRCRSRRTASSISARTRARPAIATMKTSSPPAQRARPARQVALSDPWTLMYTSGTTGNPKGVVRSHRSAVLLSMVTEIELGLHRNDGALLVMPMCHANSLNFFGAFGYCGGVNSIYSRKSFDPEHRGEDARRRRLDLHLAGADPLHHDARPAAGGAQPIQFRRRHQADDLVGAGAAARPSARSWRCFPNSGLFELYGATETGWVTMLHPHEQFTKLGSVGRECVGAAPIRILDEAGNEVPDGESGELFSCNAHTFDCYWRLPEKTKEAFRGDYCSVGDMARRDARRLHPSRPTARAT